MIPGGYLVGIIHPTWSNCLYFLISINFCTVLTGSLPFSKFISFSQRGQCCKTIDVLQTNSRNRVYGN